MFRLTVRVSGVVLVTAFVNILHVLKIDKLALLNDTFVKNGIIYAILYNKDVSQQKGCKKNKFHQFPFLLNESCI